MRIVIQILDVLALFLIQPELLRIILGEKGLAKASAWADRLGSSALRLSSPVVFLAVLRPSKRRVKVLSRPDFYRLQVYRRIWLKAFDKRGDRSGQEVVESIWRDIEPLLRRSASFEWEKMSHDEALKHYFAHVLEGKSSWDAYGATANELASPHDWVLAGLKMIFVPVAYLILVALLWVTIWRNWNWWLLAVCAGYAVLFASLLTVSNILYSIQLLPTFSPLYPQEDRELLDTLHEVVSSFRGCRIDLFYTHYWLRMRSRQIVVWFLLGTSLVSMLIAFGVVPSLSWLTVLVTAPVLPFAVMSSFHLLVGVAISAALPVAVLVKWSHYLRQHAQRVSRILVILGALAFLLARVLSLWD